MPVKNREVVDPIADVEVLVVRDGVPRTRKSRSQSVSDQPADPDACAKLKETCRSMKLKQVRDSVDALIREQDALEKNKNSTIKDMARAKSVLAEAADDLALDRVLVEEGVRVRADEQREVGIPDERRRPRDKRQADRQQRRAEERPVERLLLPAARPPRANEPTARRAAVA